MQKTSGGVNRIVLGALDGWAADGTAVELVCPLMVRRSH